MSYKFKVRGYFRWVFFNRGWCYQETRSSAKTETGTNTCATCLLLRGESPFCVIGRFFEEVELLFSSQKALSLDIHYSRFLSESSGNCFIFKIYFILFHLFIHLFIYFFFSNPRRFSQCVADSIESIYLWGSRDNDKNLTEREKDDLWSTIG